MSPTTARLLAGVFLLLLGGCAGTMQTRALLDSPIQHLPRHVELAGVPYFPQEDYQCGPAALAMALHHAGIKIAPEALKPEMYLPGKQGTLQVEMMAAARRNGVVAYPLSPRLEALLAELDDGTPVIVLQNLALSWYPMWHYAVVIGYDLDRAEIILRSGREQRQVMAMTTFERTWERSGYWAMLAAPPDKVPAGAEEFVYVSAASALEKSGHPERARTAYLAALARWPGNLLAQIGVGNTSYKMKEFAQAETAFKRAILEHPDSAVALNNLAQTLIDLERFDEALTYARRAVALGGQFSDSARATLNEIEGRLRK